MHFLSVFRRLPRPSCNLRGKPEIIKQSMRIKIQFRYIFRGSTLCEPGIIFSNGHYVRAIEVWIRSFIYSSRREGDAHACPVCMCTFDIFTFVLVWRFVFFLFRRCFLLIFAMREIESQFWPLDVARPDQIGRFLVLTCSSVFIYILNEN